MQIKIWSILLLLQFTTVVEVCIHILYENTKKKLFIFEIYINQRE